MTTHRRTIASYLVSVRTFIFLALLSAGIACSSGKGPGGDTGETGNGMPGNAGGQINGTGSTGAGTGGGGGSTVGGGGGSSVNSGGGTGTTGGAGPGGGSGGTGSGGVMMGADEDYEIPADLQDEDGSRLWLRYPQVPIPMRLAEYQAAFTHVVSEGSSATLDAAEEELLLGLSGLTGQNVMAAAAPTGAGAVVIGTPDSSPIIDGLALDLTALGEEGYLVQTVEQGGEKITVIAGNTDIGALYGSFALLRHLQSHNAATALALSGSPKVQHRLLNHWDNLDRSVERGYAGQSLWNWSALPGTLSPRYKEYARANASIGINGAVLTNVNATKNNNEDMWATGTRAAYFQKVKALADVFRPYGIRVYLTAPFNASGNTNPNDAGTKAFWKTAMDEIYAQIPDFGGLLIKASSEGEPGPSNGATHADGANMLATAIGSRGIVMWRAFVYSSDLSPDRIRQAYEEFKPLDGDFASNVLVQPKNGPLDFQPREPFHPLFGEMPQTPLALEFQITKEYLGQDRHLAYLGTYWEEVLQADTYANGAGSTVAHVVDGSVHNYSVTAMAGVSNIGSDTNWTGSQFNQANWYAYGRMAWDPDISAHLVAEEWVRQTFSNDPVVVAPVVEMMMDSREHLVNYMTPLGLVHIMGTDHHFGPAPWVNELSTDNWNPFYYHKADAQGIGYDRTASGSNAVDQYATQVTQVFGDKSAVPEEFLLFFHRVGWDETTASGRTVWEELVHLYSMGVDGVADMKTKWALAKDRVDAARYDEVTEFLNIQHYEARWWRDACLTYFSSRSGKAIPSGYSPPANNLAFYQGLTCPSNVEKPRCPQIEMGSPSPAVLR